MQLPSAEACEALLRRHVIDAWFPRCLDLDYGGFLADFDRAWKPCGPHEKLLEFQARQTCLAAELFQFAPSDNRLREAALHGFYFLRDVMWDRHHGGWFHRTDRAGEPLESHTKHAHGIAYAIVACAAVHAATGETGALQLAWEGFAWLEQYAHDKEHGGYFGFLRQDGTIIREVSGSSWWAAADTIGTPIGLKDSNVHSDLLRTFTYLYRLRLKPILVERLHEMVQIFCGKILTSAGALWCLYEADWTPVPHLVQHGYGFQAAHRLLAVRDVIGTQEKLIGIARRLVDFALRFAWDKSAGGFFYASPGSVPTQIEGHDLVVCKKSWWVQFEALNALLSLSCAAPNSDAYLHYFKAQWQYIEAYLIDSQQGGVYPVGLDSLPRWRRWLCTHSACTRKGEVWKDASHESFAWLYCASALRSISTDGAMIRSQSSFFGKSEADLTPCVEY